MYGKKTEKTRDWSDRWICNWLFAAGPSRGAKPPCWRARDALGSDKQTMEITLTGQLAPKSFRPGYLALYSRTRNILYLKRACFGLWLKERGILHLKRACFALWLIERGILHLKRACFALRLIEQGILHLKRAK